MSRLGAMVRAQLSIVILNYRTPQLVVDCLESLVGEARELGAHVIVVDNCSGDDSVEKISDWIDS